MVARELVLALERLGRPRYAAGVALRVLARLTTRPVWARDRHPPRARGRPRRAGTDTPGDRDRPGRTDLVPWYPPCCDFWRVAGDARGSAFDPRAAEHPARHGPRSSGTSPGNWPPPAPPATRRSGGGADRARWRRPLRRHLAARRGTAARLDPAVRTWRRGRGRACAARALHGVPTARWPVDFLVAIARGLRDPPAAPTRRRCRRAPRRSRRCPNSTSKKPSPTCATAHPNAR